MADPTGQRLFVNLGPSQARRRLKGFGHGVRKVQSAGRNQTVIIHTATGRHLAELEAKFADVGYSDTQNGLDEGASKPQIIAQPAEVTYQLEPQLSAEEFIDVLERSTLAERRPVQDQKTMEGMLANASLILTARSAGRLVGVSRAITDYHYCTYLSDLAVDQDFQRQGIGKELIRRTHAAAGLHTTLILLSAPKAVTYYPHIGMTKHESCWIIPRQVRTT